MITVMTSYNERKDVEALQTREQMLGGGRKGRVRRAVTRFVPVSNTSSSTGGKGLRKSYEGAFDHTNKKKKKRRSRWPREESKARRERKLRRRVKKLILAGQLDVNR